MKQRICDALDCQRRVHAMKLCVSHYNRLRSGRQVNAPMVHRSLPTEERFWANVDKGGGPEACWPWLGRTHQGYGRSSLSGHNYQLGAHRVAWFWVHGSLPPQGMHLDHLCRNRRCVNTNHLEVVTPRENTMRSANAAFKHYVSRTSCERGHPLEGENLAIRSGGGRKCRACHNDYMRAYNKRRRTQSADERRARALLRARSGGSCEIRITDVCTGQAQVWSHRKRRSQSSKAEMWSLTNGLHSCRSCEAHLTDYGSDAKVRSHGWTVHPTLDPARVPALRRGVLTWLYPDGSFEPCDLTEIAEWIGGAA